MREKKDTRQAVKILRMANDLSKERLTIKQIAKRFEVSWRTAYRYIEYIEAAQLPIDVDFHKRYFIATK